jgi:molybdopterin molybdotransferase
MSAMPETMISLAAAQAAVLAAAAPLESEQVQLAEALGRRLCRGVAAAADAPPFDASAMDGYAVLPGPAGRRLEVIGESRAGTPGRTSPTATSAVRISTGGTVPPGEVGVLRQEDTVAEDGTILTTVEVTAGANVRRAGEDMRRGTVVLEAGRRVDPVGLAAAAAAGVSRLEMHRRPRVRILCTGDELREPGAPLAPGQIHDSNGPMLAALAGAQAAQVSGVARVGDDPARTERELAEALADCDVLVTCGGVSVGPHDHVKPALARLGVEEIFWRVALQPGKPTWFGRRGRVLVFGLPGNPVSAAVTFSLFVTPALRALQGARGPAEPPLRAGLARPVARNPERVQAIRVRLTQPAAGLQAEPTGPQGSHLLSSLVQADALALIPAGRGELAAGELVALVPAPGRERGEWAR